MSATTKQERKKRSKVEGRKLAATMKKKGLTDESKSSQETK